MPNPELPCVLVIDDFFGRVLPESYHRDRVSLCEKFRLADRSEGKRAQASFPEGEGAMANAVFYRGQTPTHAGIGDVIENDLEGCIEIANRGYTDDAGNHRPWALILLDLCFYTGIVTASSNRRAPGMPEGRPADDDPRRFFGLEALRAIHARFPDLPVVILSSKSREEVSVEFSNRGALGFIARDDLRGLDLLQAALWQHGLLVDPEERIVGASLNFLLALRDARRAAGYAENILIRGERGTGKELLADYVHRMAIERRGGPRPFVPVNSAVFTQTLFASELFGIEAKTATGVDAKVGLIESAHGGDLFLDEVADMPTEVQAAVLRVLQERKVTPVGARKSRGVNVRFLSATNVEIEGSEIGFRADLLDRLRMGGSIRLPALRDRKTDIPLLVERFVREAEARRSGVMKREITPEALVQMLQYDWPGNVRELASCIFDAVSRNPDVEHLVPGHLRLGDQKTSTAVAALAGMASESRSNSLPSPKGDLSLVLDTVRSCDFGLQAANEWTGRLEELQLEHARMVARYLRAALETTKRRTPDAPEGQIQIHPAVKLIVGDSSLTASQAADIIKRLLGPIVDELAGVLKDAYDVAVRLRPKAARRSQAPPH